MSRLVVVANRLPVRRVQSEGQSEWATSPGGLVSALHPPLQARDGAWIGWSGASSEALEPFQHDGIEHRVVPLTEAELENYYEGFANASLWPLYHDAVRPPQFQRRWWNPYVDVNRRYADATAQACGPGDVAWIQDYHLQLVPKFLREQRPGLKIGFFMHIPFPPQELFAQLPWRGEVLEGLLGADQVGFQTPRGAQNFLECVERYTDAEVRDGSVIYQGREVRVDAFPISIDVQRYAEIAKRPEVIQRALDMKRTFGPTRRILLGVDRLDYTKGIDVRLSAFELLLERQNKNADDFAFIQVAVPSRESVRSYASMRTGIEQRVGRINGNHGQPGRVPVHYLYRNLPIEELVAYYLAADVMVVTPLRDGMNLVAKEYIATRTDETGALVLSEFAGAAHELSEALLVNPHDLDGMASTFERALDTPFAESRDSMRKLRQRVVNHDVHQWAAEFLESLQP